MYAERLWAAVCLREAAAGLDGLFDAVRAAVRSLLSENAGNKK